MHENDLKGNYQGLAYERLETISYLRLGSSHVKGIIGLCLRVRNLTYQLRRSKVNIVLTLIIGSSVSTVGVDGT